MDFEGLEDLPEGLIGVGNFFRYVGAFFKWLFTGCKRSLADVTYDDNPIINAILGIIMVALLITAIVLAVRY